MNGKISALDSGYVIDGVTMEATPRELLMECCPVMSEACTEAAGEEFAPVIDESADPAPGGTGYDRTRIYEYLETVKKHRRKNMPLGYPESLTRLGIASSVIGTIWKEGCFRLEDIGVSAVWDWDPQQIGSMAAFYRSAGAASEYIYDLGINLNNFNFNETKGRHEVLFKAGAAAEDNRTATAELRDEMEPSGECCHISEKDRIPGRVADDGKSWIIYIPFDTCSFRLGGSVFEEATGHGSDNAPEIHDPDYFIDCYEVIRELSEDGIIMSGRTVGHGGLLAAMDALCSGRGMDADISGIKKAYSEQDPVRILFSEIPGVLIQISDSDYDYVDAQLLLQDIAYFPVGHPGKKGGKLKILQQNRSDVSGILASLLLGQSSEGED